MTNPVRIGFYWPTGEDQWTDEAIVGLIGQRLSVTLHDGVIGTGIVTDARRHNLHSHDTTSVGLWLEIEA